MKTKTDKISYKLESNRLGVRINKIATLEGNLLRASWAVEEAEDSAMEALDDVLDTFPGSRYHGADDAPGALCVKCVGEGSTFVSVMEDVVNALNTEKLRLTELRAEALKKEEANDE